MSKVGESTESNSVQLAIEKKINELTELVALQEYGPEGPPKDLTWRQIERLGHGTGQTIAQRISAAIQQEHQEHFEDPQPCPQCGQACIQSDTTRRDLETLDGKVPLEETQFHCNACRRSFFPSTNRIGD